ncbi:MAG: glycosyltransferase family 2 protein [Lentisphaerae bacterium]|nr:glycosyltransferase family 2 protein [Lentisphaerota bacterium]
MSAAPRGSSEKITVCIICGNEEENIERCLKSVTWADEVLVVDSFSRDRTPEIARRYTPHVIQQEWLGYIGQKKFIADLAKGPWILFVDADEEISPALRQEIEALFSRPLPPEVHGFECPRLVPYLGRWIRHGDWYPDTKLRLFKKAFGECGGKEPHDRVYVTGEVRRLRGELFHYTYTDIEDQLATINRFSTISARTNDAEGRTVSMFDLIFRPTIRFIRGYVFKLGFLDGVPGLIVARNVAFGTFAKYAKLWELQNVKRKKSDEGGGRASP